MIFSLGGGDITISGAADVAVCLLLLFCSVELSAFFFWYVGGGSVIKDLLPEMALWEMHSGAKMVPFCCVFKVSGGSLPDYSLKLL